MCVLPVLAAPSSQQRRNTAERKADHRRLQPRAHCAVAYRS
ncbi:hypothetical protein XCR_2694 [Xanthomonas campestris pv. raphani 756C]|nr:hypothetical protein XCR_2694 [Xanthomonas campestris pv. raphani 756C]